MRVFDPQFGKLPYRANLPRQAMRTLKPKHVSPQSPWPRRIEWFAFGLMLALVITRGSMQEFLREPFEVMPGSDVVPRAAGPAASIGLDLLCCIPALLVLTRRLIDQSIPLRTPRSLIPLALLSGWMLLSTLWAADKFGALVTAGHWTAAVAMLWAALQLVRDWCKLRLVAAVAFGLLPIYVIHGLNYKFIELPDLIKNFEANKEKYFSQRGLQEGSFAATQFAAKIRLGEMFGYETSPNSFGALLSLLLVVSAGLLIQRLSDLRREPPANGPLPISRPPVDPTATAVAIGMILGLWIMAYTRSRTAFATPVIAIALFLIVWKYHERMALHAKKFYLLGVTIFVLLIAAVIGHGLAHGSLIHSSLTFRWHYWIGSIRIFRLHPLLGVGWNSFGFHYLAQRLAKAPEEIKDPHNFLVRFFTELGFIGGVLAIVWQLRLWWELTRPISPSNPTPKTKSPGVLSFIALVAGSGVFLSTVLSVDFSMGAVELDVLRRFLFVGAMVIASSLAALRTLQTQDPDDRPAPWLLYAILIGVGVFLIHNLIDFSLFEIGPMMLFAVLTGSALGIRRQTESDLRTTPKNMAILYVAAIALWLTTAVIWWVPVLQAERAANAADDAIHANHLDTALPLLEEANRQAWRLNAEYAFRAALVSPPQQFRSHINEAILENPLDVPLYVARIHSEMRNTQPDHQLIRDNFNTALKLDPYNVPMRLEYAKALTDFGDRAAAVEQFEMTLRVNDLLNWDEKKRLPPEEVTKIQNQIRALLLSPPPGTPRGGLG